MLFGFFSPKSPLVVREKAWTEIHMRWLARQFGAERLLRAAVVLPDNWLPQASQGTADDARGLLDRISDFMQISRSSIQLEVCEDAAMHQACGQCQPGTVRLTESQLADPDRLAAILIREVSRELLLGRGLLPDDFDAQWVIDLLPVYVGLGVFTANAVLEAETECHGQDGRCATRRHGLSAPMIGYALALFAWVRNERSPQWADCLHPGAANLLAAGLHYLDVTEDAVFSRETCHLADRPTAWCAILDRSSKVPFRLRSRAVGVGPTPAAQPR